MDCRFEVEAVKAQRPTATSPCCLIHVSRSYWVSLVNEQIKPRGLIIASRNGQAIQIHESDQSTQVDIMLNDEMINFDENVTVSYQNKILFNDKPKRSISEIYRTLKERGDPGLVFSSRIEIKLN